jgi:hypothetical protein
MGDRLDIAMRRNLSTVIHIWLDLGAHALFEYRGHPGIISKRYKWLTALEYRGLIFVAEEMVDQFMFAAR